MSGQAVGLASHSLTVTVHLLTHSTCLLICPPFFSQIAAWARIDCAQVGRWVSSPGTYLCPKGEGGERPREAGELPPSLVDCVLPKAKQYSSWESQATGIAAARCHTQQ